MFLSYCYLRAQYCMSKLASVSVHVDIRQLGFYSTEFSNTGLTFNKLSSDTHLFDTIALVTMIVVTKNCLKK